jgi:hypothetical protein
MGAAADIGCPKAIPKPPENAIHGLETGLRIPLVAVWPAATEGRKEWQMNPRVPLGRTGVILSGPSKTALANPLCNGLFVVRTGMPSGLNIPSTLWTGLPQV